MLKGGAAAPFAPLRYALVELINPLTANLIPAAPANTNHQRSHHLCVVFVSAWPTRVAAHMDKGVRMTSGLPWHIC